MQFKTEGHEKHDEVVELQVEPYKQQPEELLGFR